MKEFRFCERDGSFSVDECLMQLLCDRSLHVGTLWIALVLSFGAFTTVETYEFSREKPWKTVDIYGFYGFLRFFTVYRSLR